MGRVWVFDTSTLGWSYIDPVNDASIPPPRYLHRSVASKHPLPPNEASGTDTYAGQMTSTISKIPALVGRAPAGQGPPGPHGTMIIYGGLSTNSTPLSDTWAFNIVTRTWSALPSTPSPAPTLPSLALVNDTLYLVSGTSDFANDIHTLPLKRRALTNEKGEAETNLVATQDEWSITTIPSNPLTPGPKARKGGALNCVTSGAGREYLLYLMGEKASSSSTSTGEEKPPAPTPESQAEPLFYSDAWTYGLPPSSLTVAGLKDNTRSTLGLSTPSSTWSEVKLEANVEANAEE
ncbi:MAG: hypothetical protein Q9217_006170, partial [Psora testacea]